MKIKSGFVKRNIAGSEIVMPVGKTAAEMNSMIALSQTASFLWDCLQKNVTRQELVDAVLEEYEVDEATAEKDIDKFIATLSDNDLLEK